MTQRLVLVVGGDTQTQDLLKTAPVLAFCTHIRRARVKVATRIAPT